MFYTDCFPTEGVPMKHKPHKNMGMTLVELMAVIAIIALLASIMAFFVSGNRESRAQIDLANDITSLLQAQRTRAATMNVASYVRFSSNTKSMYIEPRLGRTSACIGDLEQQLPIMYDVQTSISDINGDTNGNIVRIDLTDQAVAAGGDAVRCGAAYVVKDSTTETVTASGNRYCRTLDSLNDTKFSGKLSIALDTKKLDGSDATAPKNGHLTVCFQPNGQAFFIDDDDWRDDISTANIDIGIKNFAAGEKLTVSVTNLGMIYSNRR